MIVSGVVAIKFSATISCVTIESRATTDSGPSGGPVTVAGICSYDAK